MPESKEYKYTMDDLSRMQAWPLSRKIQVTQTRLMEWKMKFKGQIYISFSGGKDSTVLADLAARIYAADQKLNPDKSDPLTLVFVNTGLEYPEIQKFTKKFAEWLRTTYEIPVNLEIRTPEMSFPEVLSKYGYPVIATRQVAKACLSAWGFTFLISHRLETALSRISKLLGSMWVPALEGNSRFSGFGQLEWAKVNRCRTRSSQRPSEIAISRLELFVLGVSWTIRWVFFAGL